MSLLSQVTTGKVLKPYLVILHGPPGVGKSTFASEAPSPIFLGAEDGTSSLNVSRLPELKSFDEVILAIKELTEEKHSFKTLVIDSLDWLEPLIWKKVCDDHKIKSIEDMGYGKGYIFALQLWQDLIKSLKTLREVRGMNIIAIAHSHIKNITDPSTNQSYDRFILKLNEKASSLWREFVDAIFFCTFETVVKEDKSGKTKAFSTGDRIMFTEWRPGMDAKNRFGLPFKMNLKFKEFDTSVKSGFLPSAKELLDSISKLTPLIKDSKVLASVTEATEKASGEPARLNMIREKIEDLIAKQ